MLSMKGSQCSQPPCWHKGHKSWGLISIPKTYIKSYCLCLSFTQSLVHSYSYHRKSDTHSVDHSLLHSPAFSPSSSGITGHETGVSGSTAAWPLFHPWNTPPTLQTASCLQGGLGWGQRERKKLVARGLAAPAGGGNGEGESENKRGPGVNAHTALNNRNLSLHTVSRSKGSPFSWPSLVQPTSDSFLVNSGTCLKLPFLATSTCYTPACLQLCMQGFPYHISITVLPLAFFQPLAHPRTHFGSRVKGLFLDDGTMNNGFSTSPSFIYFL